MKVRLTRRAVRDIQDISASIRASDPIAASRVRDALQRSFALLAVHPLVGRRFAGGRRRFALTRYPYLIFYRVNDVAQAVEIITVRHGSRSPEAR